jgi:hypothetical protein
MVGIGVYNIEYLHHKSNEFGSYYEHRYQFRGLDRWISLFIGILYIQFPVFQYSFAQMLSSHMQPLTPDSWHPSTSNRININTHQI